MLLGMLLCLWTSSARAWVLQVPQNADFATLPQGRVLCGPVPEGWILDATRKQLKPKPETAVGQTLLVAIAQQDGACSTAAVEEATLIVTGDLPVVDPNSVTVGIDSGRLEVRGTGLEGMHIGYMVNDKSGDDVCLNVLHDGDRDLCALNIDRNLPADPRRIELHWAPRGGRVGPQVVTYDKHGDALSPDATKLPVARVLISRMFPDARMVDVAHGSGKVQLVHPEAVSGADCGAGARCEIHPEGLVIVSLPAAAPKLIVRLTLAPRVFYTRGDVFDTVVGDTLTVLRCPATMVSGEPLRNVDELKVLLKLDPACAGDVQHLRFTANADQAEVQHVESMPDGVYVLLWVGRVVSDRLTMVVSREDGSVIAVSSEKTTGVPPLMTTLSLSGFGEVDFIPRNRPALVSVSHVAGKGELVPISLPGAYVVTRSEEGYMVRGVYASGGFAALRFGYRVAGVPPAFADTDFGEVTDPVQRPIREASIPAPIGASSVTPQAIVELYCKDADDKLQLIGPGTPVHIPFKQRDSCRLILHHERIPAESGEQRLDVEISVTTVAGADRGEAHLTEHLVMRHAPDTDLVWIRGAKEQFDRISIRITHVIDETLYDSASRRRLELPSSQWTVVTENARFKFYATAAIPASLYRFSSDSAGSGPLSLNLGLLSRLTWLDSDGHEGLLAIEAGMMGMALADQVQRQLAIVTGLGVAIPLGNANTASQAAVNIHMWLAYTVGKLRSPDVDGMPGKVLSSWAFVFGPSITVGSIGTLL
jgi:hypothetical protein